MFIFAEPKHKTMATVVNVKDSGKPSGSIRMSEMEVGDMAKIMTGPYQGHVVWKPTEKSPYIIMNERYIGGQNSYDAEAAKYHHVQVIDATITVEI